MIFAYDNSEQEDNVVSDRNFINNFIKNNFLPDKCNHSPQVIVSN